VFIEGLMRWK